MCNAIQVVHCITPYLSNSATSKAQFTVVLIEPRTAPESVSSARSLFQLAKKSDHLSQAKLAEKVGRKTNAYFSRTSNQAATGGHWVEVLVSKDGDIRYIPYNEWKKQIEEVTTFIWQKNVSSCVVEPIEGQGGPQVRSA